MSITRRRKNSRPTINAFLIYTFFPIAHQNNFKGKSRSPPPFTKKNFNSFFSDSVQDGLAVKFEYNHSVKYWIISLNTERRFTILDRGKTNSDQNYDKKTTKSALLRNTLAFRGGGKEGITIRLLFFSLISSESDPDWSLPTLMVTYSTCSTHPPEINSIPLDM